MAADGDRNAAHDIVLFGATGFTGGLTAEYLAAHAPADCRWALAGRNRTKLEAVRSRLAEINPDCEKLPLLHADANDPASLREVAGNARVVITTVGPYMTYGEQLVAACAEVGTDYVDLTGEPEFADLMYVRYQAKAVASGARIVHACGFDSIPHDLGAYFTVQQLPHDRPIHVDGFLRVSGQPSGGTLASALNILSRTTQTREAAKQRKKVEPTPSGRSTKAVAGKPRRDEIAQSWVVPLPTIDPQIVARSARILDVYGPDFTYSHYAAIKRLPMLAGGAVGVGALAGLAQIEPLRERLGSLRKPGEGPSEAQREKSWFTVRFHGTAGDAEVVTEVSGGDPGYGETSKMLAESALSLAFDDLPARAGQLTPAAAMGDALIERLRRAGIRFEVLAGKPTRPPSRHLTGS